MKKMYMQPEIWVEELMAESPLLGNTITNIVGKSGDSTILYYDGGGSGPARAGENNLWEDDDDTDWDQL